MRVAKGGIWAPAGLSEADGFLYFFTATPKERVAGRMERVCSGSGAIWFMEATRVSFLPHPTGSSWARRILISVVSHRCHSHRLGSDMPLLFAPGKGGNAYLLNRANLGGIGSAIAVHRAARGAIITAPVAYPTRDAILTVS
jgi:hypothetical protein